MTAAYNCLNCGRWLGGVANTRWCQTCVTQFPAAWASISTPVELPPNTPAKQRPIDIVLNWAFFRKAV